VPRFFTNIRKRGRMGKNAKVLRDEGRPKSQVQSQLFHKHRGANRFQALALITAYLVDFVADR
jgi:hypothetical protein